MIDVTKFYDVGQAKKISTLNVKSVNRLYVLDTSDDRYLIKIYIPNFYEVLPISLKAQEFVYYDLGMAPQVVRNKNDQLYTNHNGVFFSLQKFVVGEPFQLMEDTLDFYLDGLNKLHGLLNCSFENCYSALPPENYQKRDFLDQIATARNRYNLLNIRNDIYEHLLNVRTQVVEKIPTVAYNLNCRNVIHGDLRPSNVLWNGNNIIFLDFDYIANDDLLYEISSSIAMLSNYDDKVCKLFWEKYIVKNGVEIGFKELYMHLLSYYVKSNFPLNIMCYEPKSQIDKISSERIKLLKFCLSIVSN